MQKAFGNDFLFLPQFIEYLNNLGRDGWEMIESGNRGFFFKRPT